MFKKTQKELDNIINTICNDIEFKELDISSSSFLELINTSKYLITLHDVELYKPVCINDNFKHFYGFKNNWLKGADLMYYVRTIHSSTLHTLVKSVVFFKRKDPGYLNLKYKLLHHTNTYREVVGSTKTIVINDNKPKYALTLARVVSEHNIEDKQNQAESLTNREKDIAKLLTEGKTKKEIAHLLNISEATVHSHTKSIYKKLDINRIQELVQLYNELFFE